MPFLVFLPGAMVTIIFVGWKNIKNLIVTQIAASLARLSCEHACEWERPGDDAAA